MEREVWITLRFKGSMNVMYDPQSVAQKLLGEVETFINCDRQEFTVTQQGDVIEVEEEADIYDNAS